jgi:hypothetical protein
LLKSYRKEILLEEAYDKGRKQMGGLNLEEMTYKGIS